MSTDTPSQDIPEAIKARLDAAEQAVTYALRRIAEVPEIFWHCGTATG